MFHDSELSPVHVLLYCTLACWKVERQHTSETPVPDNTTLNTSHLVPPSVAYTLPRRSAIPYRSEVVATLSHDNIATRFDWTLIVLGPAQQKVSICRHCSTVQYAQGVPGRRNSSMAGPLSDRAWPKAENPE